MKRYCVLLLFSVCLPTRSMEVNCQSLLKTIMQDRVQFLQKAAAQDSQAQEELDMYNKMASQNKQALLYRTGQGKIELVATTDADDYGLYTMIDILETAGIAYRDGKGLKNDLEKAYQCSQTAFNLRNTTGSGKPFHLGQSFMFLASLSEKAHNAQMRKHNLLTAQSYFEKQRTSCNCCMQCCACQASPQALGFIKDMLAQMDAVQK